MSAPAGRWTLTGDAAMDVEVRLPASGKAAQVSAAVDRLVAWVVRHWLAMFNAIIAIFVLLPFVAPVLMRLGATGPARAIYLVYSPTCHQLPERSFFLFGERSAYSVVELEGEDAIPPSLTLLQRELLRWNGNPQIGYKVAICQRDIAIYGSLLVGGLVYGAMRGWRAWQGRGVPKLPVKGYLILLAPMIADGGTQLIGLRESTWELRLITGILFGLATIWLAYPTVEEAMQDAGAARPANQQSTAKPTPSNWTKASD
jgi:uncharacterized membrane protein